MAQSPENHYRDSDLKGLSLLNARLLQLLQDAENPNEAVRLSQAEAIAAAAVQEKIITDSGNATLDTYFASTTIVNLLAQKQANLTIHPSSVAFAQLLNGSQLKITRLTTNEVAVNNTCPDLATCLALPSTTYNAVDNSWDFDGEIIQKGDQVILLQATDATKRTYVHTGGTNGDITDFASLQTGYDEAVIKAMLSAGDTFIGYDQASGAITLKRGTTLTTLGAQTLPVDPTEFTNVTGSTTLAILKALEAMIVQVDNDASGGNATTNTRLTNLSGVAGNNLESFNGSLFSDNLNIKQILQEAEDIFSANIVDRAAIRSEFATADQTLHALIQGEVAARTTAIASETSARQSDVNSLTTLINTNASSIAAEATTRLNADNAASARLDIIEGSGPGSVSKAQADAILAAMQMVAAESTSRQDADAALDLKIDNLAEGDITFIGEIETDGTLSIRADKIAAGDTRNGQAITAVDILAGEVFIIKADLTLTYTDSNAVAYEAGDKLMAVDNISTGNLVEASFNVAPANGTALSVINIGSTTIEIDGNGYLNIINDSITRDHLSALVEADIDDKRSLTQNNAITSDSDTHFVVDTSTGATQNVYYKRTSNTSDALTGTKRTLLAELFVASNGSADPLAPSFAHTATFSTHYTGTSNDMSMAVGGGNFEANVINPTAGVLATGVYSLAQSQHLGINSGVTGVAQNAGISNIGVTGFGKAGGIGKDRGGVFSLSDLDFINYAAYRSANPISYPDVALVADAGTSATGKAFVAVGDSIFESGTVIVPSAQGDNQAVNLGDIKGKEAEATVTVPAQGNVTVPHGLNSEKIIVSAWYNDEEVSGGSIKIERNGTGGITLYNQTLSDLTDVEVYISKLS